MIVSPTSIEGNDIIVIQFSPSVGIQPILLPHPSTYLEPGLRGKHLSFGTAHKSDLGPRFLEV